MEPLLDHVVIDVQDRIDEAAQRYRALGFQLTERGRHTLGSENHLAMFGFDYLELLGTGEAGSAVRTDLAGFPIGLNGIVFKLERAEQTYSDLKGRGIPVQPVQSFSRPVNLAGRRREARFKAVRLVPRSVFDGRVYFCEHLTPELVWRPEWEEHPNGALAIARVVISAQYPSRIAEMLDQMFGVGIPGQDIGGGRRLELGSAMIEIVPNATLAGELGDALPHPHGRGDHMALLGVRVRSLSRAQEALRTGQVQALRIERDRILVYPSATMNVALEFRE